MIVITVSQKCVCVNNKARDFLMQNIIFCFFGSKCAQELVHDF